MQHGFYFDHKRCVKCHACEIACKSWNEVDVGPRWREVVKIESGTYPDVQAMNVSMACMHCGDAPCRTAWSCDRDHEEGGRRNRCRRSPQVHRLRVLHLGLPIQRPSALDPGREDGEVQLLSDARARAAARFAARMRGDLPHGSDSLRLDGGTCEARPRIRGSATRVHAGISRTGGSSPSGVRTAER